MQRPAHGIEVHYYYSDLRVCTHILEPFKALSYKTLRQTVGFTGINDNHDSLFICRGYVALNGRL
jgi:hypothetical protein